MNMTKLHSLLDFRIVNTYVHKVEELVIAE